MKKQSNNYDYVDLGLPSGTLWATCNVGANKPWEYGKYFAWGDTKGYYDNEKHDFSWNSYKWCNGAFNTLTKYNNHSGCGSVDDKLVLDPDDDAVHVHMGGDWHMPTLAQLNELLYFTTQQWVENYQGTSINGRLYTSRKDTSKFIFIPASGYHLKSYVKYKGSDAYLWGSTLYTDYPSGASGLYFNSDNYDIYDFHRYNGFCVRGVKKNK